MFYTSRRAAVRNLAANVSLALALGLIVAVTIGAIGAHHPAMMP